jgi:hypothetical protein
MKLAKAVYALTLFSSKREIALRHGKGFYKSFARSSAGLLRDILPKIPDIGESVFSFNYQFCPSYIVWYKSYLSLGLTSDEAMREIWMMNEKLVRLIPGIFRRLSANMYLGTFRKKGRKHEARSESGEVHPYDWKVRYRELGAGVFEIDIYECAMIKVSRDFDALGMYPMVCRMDYLFSHYMGSGFLRTKTLGDGDDCCNCRYILPGSCEWSPEKGFEDRK